MTTLSPSIENLIVPRVTDLGGFNVRRALPTAGRKMVGPFIFLDQMGPAEFLTETGLDVRPHPHIGLATVTYLIEGQIFHRDSLGTELPIQPGDVNWMSAGRGIVHSERTPPELRPTGSKLFGLQSWVALPEDKEEGDPSFSHIGIGALPMIEAEGKVIRVIAGTLWGATAPTPTASDTIYADVTLEPGASLPLDAVTEERAVYTLSGEIDVAGDRLEAGALVVFRPGDPITIRALTPTRLFVLGGASMNGPRYIWWNFVSSRRERILSAKADWEAGKFDAVPNESEWIPTPVGNPRIIG
ncbi:pirin family protein [Methyloraptor flagellatus]|uniref:Pirin family protein n=1 Tax=Methyloraptor flagellatus TaxID=3162530 RepID=A0AAU7X925_9HYPH